MDRDDMRDNIDAERQQQESADRAARRRIGKAPELGMPYVNNPLVSGGDPYEAFARLSRTDVTISGPTAQQMLDDYREAHPYPAMIFESPPCESFSPLTGDPKHLCAECMEFGTICRTCRLRRFVAKHNAAVDARRQITRERLRPVWWLVGTLVACFALQVVADRHCAPGRWDAGAWRCEARR